MHTLEAFLHWLRSGSVARRYAMTAFQAKYPGRSLHRAECVAQDDGSYVVQVLHGAASCEMASFWTVSKSGCGTVEVRASDLSKVLVHLRRVAADSQTP